MSGGRWTGVVSCITLYFSFGKCHRNCCSSIWCVMLFTWQLTTVMAQVVDLFLSGVSMFICCVFVWKVRSSRHLLSGEQEVGSSTKSQRGNAKSRRLNRFPDLSFID
eukprot:TRINITY_DN3780_c0_g1_i1.p1 TRINITY_DN3780_c0_g1~~TRINITY_DN3780_c0_g1_i1.p1  ORF type:complete len:107 (+),score=15.07 TRINITY_DN3780_c0_g1_i1:1425-1745(+)